MVEAPLIFLTIQKEIRKKKNVISFLQLKGLSYFKSLNHACCTVTVLYKQQ